MSVSFEKVQGGYKGVCFRNGRRIVTQNRYVTERAALAAATRLAAGNKEDLFAGSVHGKGGYIILCRSVRR